jgi:ankyrin repeat protein
VKDLDVPTLRALLDKEPKWLAWREPSGRNALHYLGDVRVDGEAAKAATSIEIAGLLLDRGMNIDSVHEIPDDGGVFPATPLWHAYARGRNEALYAYLLQRGADPQNCMYAIAWNDDVAAAAHFVRHGAEIDARHPDGSPFLAAFAWRRFAVAEWLLRHGADVYRADAKGNTALYYAVKRRYDVGLVQLLREFGADPDRRAGDGVSPRELATQNRQRKWLAALDAAVTKP